MKPLEIELKKVTAATTLCHLCTLEQLEKFVAEAKKLNTSKKHKDLKP